MPGDPRQTWKYFAQAVIQEDDPAKLTYLMQQLYRVLKDNQEQSQPGMNARGYAIRQASQNLVSVRRRR
jgi:hypothetical protein